MDYDKDKVDDAVLALLHLTMHDDGTDAHWKGHDWAAMDRLYEKGYIADPRGLAKSVVVTEEGKVKAAELFRQLFGEIYCDLATRGDEMVSKEEFAAIQADFVESQHFIELVHFYCRDINFVCHHNTYLVTWFLHQRGHRRLHWTSGYYQCQEPTKGVRHSWIKLKRGSKLAAIFEFDPQQLYEQGGYENDPMPSGYIPECSMTVAGTASIVDPDIVELPEEAKESPWVVPSREILSRYVEKKSLAPKMNFAALTEIGIAVWEEFDLFRKSWTGDRGSDGN